MDLRHYRLCQVVLAQRRVERQPDGELYKITLTRRRVVWSFALARQRFARQRDYFSQLGTFAMILSEHLITALQISISH